ncbi:MAG: alanine--tRNA ligase [Candidatus Aminicenantes bacterium]|nr:alanine--tRNA ligase [Candidatus Aminicenantes bacterium]
MTASEVRRAFLDFFAGKGHKVVPSSSLLPKDDPTLLFTNAGMNQFKNVFLGLERRSYSRAATVQKCLRVSGKHNDLEQVGRTAKHHTFFEMLGNFSFGDYFKKEAIAFAWELVTDVYGLDRGRLYATVYEDDDEAHDIWRTDVGLPPERIFRFGLKDNFWAMGETGPCGPCSELHYDLSPGLEPGDPRTLIERGGDRFVELWNLVFMQFEQDGSGTRKRLPKPSIDTGMGLERMTAVLQGKSSNWETDLFLPLIREVAAPAGREYPAGDEGDVSVRVIADHARAVAFLIGDGILPANDGRGYVLRRLIRRAFRHGNKLGLEKPFVYTLLGTVADIMKDAYPELLTALPLITKVCQAEEERFAWSLSSGLRTFRQVAEEAARSGGTVLNGEAAFKLYDTYGFPLDLTQELAGEVGLTVDDSGFGEELEKQKTRARQSWKGEVELKEKRVYEDLKGLKTSYAGHGTPTVPDARVLALFRDGKRVDALETGETGEVVLDLTPFYAEAGGQVGDTGILKNVRLSAVVENAHYPSADLRSHKVRILAGAVREGDRVEATVDSARRKAVRDNHTATHLLHAALRETLGEHVKQSGSLVAPQRLRFDFTHFAPLAPEEIARVEILVNAKIRENLPVAVVETTLEEGLKAGAMAIFEEKYGERVRLVSVGDYSRELCGGDHAPATGELGLFKVVAEMSVAAGLRRIEALSGEEALRHVQESDRLLQEASRVLNVSRRDLPAQVERLQAELKDREQALKAARQKLVLKASETPGEGVKTVKGVSVLVRRSDGLTPDEARALADALKQRLKSGVVVIGSVREEKAFLVVGVTSDLTPRLSAAAVIKRLAPSIGGGGGGRADFAQAGGPKTEALETALGESLEVIAETL